MKLKEDADLAELRENLVKMEKGGIKKKKKKKKKKRGEGENFLGVCG